MKVPWNRMKGMNKNMIVYVFVCCQLKSIRYLTAFELNMPRLSASDSCLNNP